MGIGRSFGSEPPDWNSDFYWYPSSNVSQAVRTSSYWVVSSFGHRGRGTREASTYACGSISRRSRPYLPLLATPASSGERSEGVGGAGMSDPTSTKCPNRSPGNPRAYMNPFSNPYWDVPPRPSSPDRVGWTVSGGRVVGPGSECV